MLQACPKIHLLGFCLLATFLVSAQPVEKKSVEPRFNVLFGLSQPLVANGFNFEVDVFYKRLAFDFSHGVSLDFSGKGVTGDVAKQKLAVHIPYTTGFGIGYRFTNAFSLRIEPKWHQFELYYDGEAQTPADRITRYNTFSLGVGAYYCWLPFLAKTNALKGIMISPSVRYWPTVSSTLSDDKITYANKMTGVQQTHERMQPGIANTPLVINVSVGYSFLLRKKK